MNFSANTLTALAACAALGILAGAVGTFVVARRRALVADVAAHATLPGACLGFLAGHALEPEGRPMWPMLVGAGISALLAAWCVAPLSRLRRLGPDGATATALAGFFGLGAVLVSLVQSHESGTQGGLRQVLFGNAAGMTASDLRMVLVICALALTALVLLRDRLTAIAFDAAHAQHAGVSVRALDLVLTVLLVATMVAGLQTVGVVLVIALLLAPAAAARQFSRSIAGSATLASLLGGVCAVAGALLSWRFEHLPSGATIVLVAAAAFVAALLLRHAKSWRGAA